MFVFRSAPAHHRQGRHLSHHFSAAPVHLALPPPSVRSTHIRGHTHTHSTPYIASDHLSQDVYGPLFAVLVIIVTGWFHYPWCSDGCGLPWRPLIWVSLTTGADAMNRGNSNQGGTERGSGIYLFLSEESVCHIFLHINTIITIPPLLSWQHWHPLTFARYTEVSDLSVRSGL